MAARFVLGLICAALIAGILQTLTEKSSCARVIQILCGIFLMVTALKPLKTVEFPDISAWAKAWDQEADRAVQEGEAIYNRQYASVIKEQLEAYILDIASQLGLSITAQLELTREGLPDSVTFTGEAGQREKEKLQERIAKDLGIPKEKQLWRD